MPTTVILPALHALDPTWANYYDRGTLKDTDLASLLSYFDAKPGPVWIPEGAVVGDDGEPKEGHTARGYKYDDLLDAWTRYLPAEEDGASVL